jgi:chromosome segregation ATPase
MDQNRNQNRFHNYLHYDAGHNNPLVYGRVCSLFKIKDLERHAIALQTVLGGAIRNVVVENKDVASRLIELRSPERITFLPLAQLQVPRMDDHFRNHIQSLSNGRACLAVDLISSN